MKINKSKMEKMKIKFLLVLLAGSVLFVGCGEKDKESEQPQIEKENDNETNTGDTTGDPNTGGGGSNTTTIYDVWVHADSGGYTNGDGKYEQEKDELYLTLSATASEIRECGLTYFTTESVLDSIKAYDNFGECEQTDLVWKKEGELQDCDYNYKFSLSDDGKILTYSRAWIGETDYSEFLYTRYSGKVPCDTVYVW